MKENYELNVNTVELLERKKAEKRQEWKEVIIAVTVIVSVLSAIVYGGIKWGEYDNKKAAKEEERIRLETVHISGNVEDYIIIKERTVGLLNTVSTATKKYVQIKNEQYPADAIFNDIEIGDYVEIEVFEGKVMKLTKKNNVNALK